MKITRQEFIDAIERAIDCSDLRENEIQLLRHVARTETVSTWGTFEAHTAEGVCFCPLSAAGLASDDARLSRFFDSYDKDILRVLRGHASRLHGVIWPRQRLEIA